MTDMPDHIAEIASGLEPMEREWFFTTEWGSWLFGIGRDLAKKGLCDVSGRGTISLTPLGQKVRRYLQENDDGKY